jgi:hypothetical protein
LTGPGRHPEERVSETVDELLESLDRVLSILKARAEARLGTEIENLLRVKRILEGLDPDEVDALLEDEDEEE